MRSGENISNKIIDDYFSNSVLVVEIISLCNTLLVSQKEICRPRHDRAHLPLLCTQRGDYGISKTLRTTQVAVTSHWKCRLAYSLSTKISDHMFCASADGKDACQVKWIWNGNTPNSTDKVMLNLYARIEDLKWD